MKETMGDQLQSNVRGGQKGAEEGPQQSPGVGSPARSSRSRKRRHEGDRTPRGEDRGGEPPRARPGRDEKGDEAHPPVSRTGRTRSEGTVASRGSKKSDPAPELPKKEVNPFHPAKVGYEEKSQVFRKHALPPSESPRGHKNSRAHLWKASPSSGAAG